MLHKSGIADETCEIDDIPILMAEIRPSNAMSLSYAELWFLETAVIGRILLGFLPESASEQAQAYSPQWNSPTHGLALQEIADTLWLLYKAGDIRFQCGKSLDEDPVLFLPSRARELVPLIEEGRDLLRDFRQWRMANRFSQQDSDPPPWNLHYTYSMTPQGVARWEESALPDWSRFRGDFDGRLEEPGETIWNSCAMTESFAREMMEVESLSVTQPAIIHWETAEVEHLTPWKPIEGKFLPHGVNVSVKVTELDGRVFQLENPVRANEQCDEHWKRFCEISRPWYQHGVKDHPDRPRPAK